MAPLPWCVQIEVMTGDRRLMNWLTSSFLCRVAAAILKRVIERIPKPETAAIAAGSGYYNLTQLRVTQQGNTHPKTLIRHGALCESVTAVQRARARANGRRSVISMVGKTTISSII